MLWTKIVIIGGDKAVFTFMRTGQYGVPRNQWISPKNPSLEVQHAHRIVIERTSAFLDRSGASLVDFVFDLGKRGSISASSNNNTMELEALLRNNLHRARSLDGASTRNLDWSSILSRGSDDHLNAPWMPLHNMVELKLAYTVHDFHYMIRSHLTLRPILFPNLRCLTINQFSLRSNSLLALGPVQNFTWAVNSPDFSDVIKHLENASNLREFTFTNPDLAVSVPPTSQLLPLVTLELLKTFDWSFPLPHHVPLFFLLVSPPNLEDLTIRLRRYGDNRASGVPNHPLITLPHLQSLRLDLVQVDRTAISCVRGFSFPSLTAFHLSSRLGANSVDRPFLPLIESIFYDPFVLGPRAAPSAGLQTLSLSGFTIWAARASSFLRRLKRLRTIAIESCTGVDDLLGYLATERQTCSDLMEVHLRNVAIEEKTLIRLVGSRTRPQNQTMLLDPPRTTQARKTTGVQMDLEKRLKGNVGTKRIRTLRLVECEGIDESARKRLRAAVDHFDYV